MRIIILMLLVGTLQAQNYHTFNVPVSVGGATNASSLLTLNSTTQGFLIPRMTTAQRDAIPTPAVGLQIYNTETNTINIFNGTWVALSGGGGIGGTVAAGQVAFGNASNTLSGSNNLVYNSITSTFGINSSPNATFHSKATASISNIFRLQDVSDSIIWNVPNARFNTATINTALTVDAGPTSGRKFSFSGNNGFATKTDAMMALINSGDGPALYVQNLAGSQTDRGPFQVYQGSNPLITTQNNRFVGINTASPTGLLTIRASGTGSSTIGFRVNNNLDQNLFSIQDDGYTIHHSGGLSLQGSSASLSTSGLYNENNSAYIALVGNQRLYLKNGSTIAVRIQSGLMAVGFNDAASARLHVRGTGTANTSSALLVQNSSATNTFSVGDAGRVTIYKDTESSGTQSSARLMVESGDANTNLVLSPKGTGAIIVGPAPDVSGNARGANAIDLQRVRNTASKVASGSSSAILGGSDNTASGLWSVVVGGSNSTASGQQSFVGGGGNNSAGAIGTVVGGGYYNVASGSFSSATGGFGTRATLYGQDAYASGIFNNYGDNQTSNIRLRNVVSNATTELFLDGISARAILTPPSGNTSRVWNARLQCVAVTNVQGTGGPAAGSVFSETMDITIKRIGSVTSIVNGTPMHSVSVSDVGMSGADFLVDADDTNESLRVRFQPPTIAAADTQIRAVCTVYLTEIGY